jgi:Mn-dependent DtxR family transcriptional regulator
LVPSRVSVGASRSEERETARLEDYLEAIYRLIHDKGYASTLDLAERLEVKPPTVSIMLQRLDSKGYLVHEPYRGMKLTTKGERIAKSVIARHAVVSEFLTLLGVEQRIAYEDTEGIEHHIHPATIYAIEGLVDYLKKNPKQLKEIRGHRGD